MIYTTEDGRQVATGEVVFNYYDRKLGTIGEDAGDGWFDHIEADGKRTLLNGARVCSFTFAMARGWIAAPATEHAALTERLVECTYCGATEWEDDEDGNPMCGECGRVKAARR